MWHSDEEREPFRFRTLIFACVFAFQVTMVFIAIVRTIITHPGNIPTEKEWDIQTDSQAESSDEEIKSEVSMS